MEYGRRAKKYVALAFPLLSSELSFFRSRTSFKSISINVDRVTGSKTPFWIFSSECSRFSKTVEHRQEEFSAGLWHAVYI